MVSEKDMRRAFGMDTFTKAKQTAVGESWYMKFTVRKSLGGAAEGTAKVVERTYPTISGFDAEMRARKECKQSGLILWAILDSHKVERDE